METLSKTSIKSSFNENIKELNFEIAVHFDQLEDLGWYFDDLNGSFDDECCVVVSINGSIENPNTYLRFEKWVDFGRMMRGQDEPTGDDEQTIEDIISIMEKDMENGVHFPHSDIKDFSVDSDNCFYPTFKNFETQYSK